MAIIVVSRVRRSGLGRSLLAVRDNELAAAAMGMSPARIKLFAFALSGALAGLAGSALVGLLVQFTPDGFVATDSIIVVAIAVVGGLSSITGVILGSLFVVGLPAFFPDSPQVALLTSGAGVLILLLYFPGGFVQILFNLRDLALAKAGGAPPRARARRATAAASRPARWPRWRSDRPSRRPSSTRARGRGGLGPVRPPDRRRRRRPHGGDRRGGGADRRQRRREVHVHERRRRVRPEHRAPSEVLGHDVQGMSPTRRAGLGLGRTFQDAALFGDLTVRETVQVAAESRARARFATVALGLPKARRVERAKQAHADEVLDLLGLGPYAQRFINELSTGMRRIVELACLFATDARMLCLDEPTAGIAQREAESFGPLLLQVRRELGASMLVIEHDMPLVMSISDRIYCLETGRVISCGTPGRGAPRPARHRLVPRHRRARHRPERRRPTCYRIELENTWRIDMDRYIVVSSDGHAGPPAELYRDYLDPEFRSRFDEHQETMNAFRASMETESSKRFVEEWEEETGGDGGLTAGYDSAARNEILDTEGVCAEVLFPDADVLGTGRVASSPFGTGLAAGSQSDPADAVAGSRAHNRWLSDFVKEEPTRRIGIAVIPAIIPDMDLVLQLVREAKDLGPHGASSSPPAGSTGPPTTSPTTTRCSRSSRSWGSCSTPTRAPGRPTTAWATGCSRSTPARPAGGRPDRCTC